MRNHSEKSKDMVESVLPSKARRSAREDRRGAHQAHRARQRERLVVLRRDPLAGDPDTDDRCAGLEVRRGSDLSWMVSARRNADNTGALVRWASAHVDRDPVLAGASVDEQVAAFRGLLPPGLMGAHAADHIRWGLRYRSPGRERGVPLGERRAASRRDVLAHRVRVLLAAGCHGELNDAIRAHLRAQDRLLQATTRKPTHVHRCPRRFLAGSDDVDAFVGAVVLDGCIRDLLHRLADRS